MVLVELGTSTDCTYCPGAAMGVDDLLANGCKVAVIENHGRDEFSNIYSESRNEFNKLIAFPTAIFDGHFGVVGGYTDSSAYTDYLPKYNMRINTPANLVLDAEVTHVGLDYTAILKVSKTGNVTFQDPVLYFFVTQSNIQHYWLGQTHLGHVNRLMVPDQDGTDIHLAEDSVQTITLTFSMDPAWPVTDCEFIAAVQSRSTRVCYNAMKMAATELQADFTATNTTINRGENITFNNFSSGGCIGVPETYRWYFQGALPNTSTLKNPTTHYPLGGVYDVQLITNRGGQCDTLVRSGYIHVNYPSGSYDLSNRPTISVYPNQGRFTLTLQTPVPAMANLRVTNPLGEQVYLERNLPLRDQLVREVDLGVCPGGVYFLTLEGGGVWAPVRIIVNRDPNDVE